MGRHARVALLVFLFLFGWLGTATARGENAAVEAARQAISCPLLEDTRIAGSRGILVNITGSGSLGLHEVSEACSMGAFRPGYPCRRLRTMQRYARTRIPSTTISLPRCRPKMMTNPPRSPMNPRNDGGHHPPA